MTHQLDPLQDTKSFEIAVYIISCNEMCQEKKKIRNRGWNGAMKQGYKDERKRY